DSGDVHDRHLSPAGRHQSVAGGVGQSAVDVPARAGAGRRAAVDRVLLRLAPRRATPAVAAAVDINQDGAATLAASRKTNLSPYRTSPILRWWKASSVER